jgi:hypothetical protein
LAAGGGTRFAKRYQKIGAASGMLSTGPERLYKNALPKLETIFKL